MVRATVLASLLTAGPALARDLPRTDPERAAILDVARGTEKVKFVVKDFFRTGDLAFLCALPQDASGHLQMTDESYDVFIAFFVKDGGGWLMLNTGGSLSPSARDVACGEKKLGSQADLAAAMGDVIRAQLADELDFGKLPPDKLQVFEVLAKKKLLTELAIEHDKQKYDPVQLKVSQDRCTTAACRSEAGKAFTALVARRDDPKVSSLVWGNCRYGLRASKLASIPRCVSAAAALPHCRPNMKLPADRKDIDRCIADIRAQCEREFPGQGFVCNGN